MPFRFTPPPTIKLHPDSARAKNDASWAASTRRGPDVLPFSTRPVINPVPADKSSQESREFLFRAENGFIRRMRAPWLQRYSDTRGIQTPADSGIQTPIDSLGIQTPIGGPDTNGTRITVTSIKERRWDGTMESLNYICTDELIMAFPKTP
jgi:hypothetical protein